MTPNTLLRRATPADIDAAARIWYEGWRDGHLGHVPEALAVHRDAPQFRTRIAARIDAVWVAEREGRVLGFVLVDGDELEQIYVDRSARGSDVASALLAQGVSLIRAAGHPVAWLAVVAGNARARAFYGRQGWRDAGEIDYLAEVETGTVAVRTHRYEIDLA